MSKSVILNIVLGISLVVAIYGITYQSKLKSDLDLEYRDLIGKTVNQKQLEDKIVQLQTEYKYSTDLLAELRSRFSALQVKYSEKVKSVTDTSVGIKGSVTTDKVVRLDGEKSPEVCFTAEDKLGLYPFTISQNISVLKDTKTGEERMVAQAYFILDKGVDSSWAGVPYKLSSVSGNYQTDPTEQKAISKFIYLPLNLNIGINSTLSPTLTATLVGYGKSKADLLYKLLSVGINYTKENKITLGGEIISRKILPDILTNTYIGITYFNVWGIQISAGL